MGAVHIYTIAVFLVPSLFFPKAWPSSLAFVQPSSASRRILGALYQSTTSSSTVRPILTPDTDPNGVLRQIAAPVLQQDGEDELKLLKEEIKSLHATLRHTQETLGFGRAMAAPQAAISKRIIVMNLMVGSSSSSASSSTNSGCPITLINPEITWRSEERQTVWDDCLSIPEKLVEIERHKSISVQFQDIHGVVHEWERLPPDLSELLQHELEHLDGILMLNHATDTNVKPNDLSHLSTRPAQNDRRRIRLENIQKAYSEIDAAFTNSPLLYNGGLSNLFGMNVWLKDETSNPIRCFKGRGADYFLSQCTTTASSSSTSFDSNNQNNDNKNNPHTPQFVCASAGNWGLAVAYCCRNRGFPCTVFVPETANPIKVAKLQEQGAKLVRVGRDLDSAKDAAKKYHLEQQQEQGSTSTIYFVEDGKEAAVTEGAGSIGVELTCTNLLEKDNDKMPELFDAVLVPVGNGALINGVARWIQAASPMTKIIGVVPAGADSMYQSWKEDKVVNRDSVSTSADGLAVREPIPEAMDDMKGLVDDMILIEEHHLDKAMALAEQHANMQLEPSGAASIAGLLAAQEQLPQWWNKLQSKNVAVVVTGANRR